MSIAGTGFGPLGLAHRKQNNGSNMLKLNMFNSDTDRISVTNSAQGFSSGISRIPHLGGALGILVGCWGEGLGKCTAALAMG